MRLLWQRKCSASFNPRTRRGCDAKLKTEIEDGKSFNPRTRRGCDNASGSPIFSMLFQSTHPQGVRREAWDARRRRLAVSIHAPAGGATGDARIICGADGEFQSTHPQGVRQALGCLRVCGHM